MKTTLLFPLFLLEVFLLLRLVKKNQKSKIHAQNPDKAVDQTSERLLSSEREFVIKQTSICGQVSERLNIKVSQKSLQCLVI